MDFCCCLQFLLSLGLSKALDKYGPSLILGFGNTLWNLFQDFLKSRVILTGNPFAKFIQAEGPKQKGENK
jgi:hypothetical protein